MSARKSKRRQIVVVDDDQAVLETFANVLTTWGYDTVPFNRFEDARTFLTENASDILIVDVRLGKYNGLQLIHLARQQHPQMMRRGRFRLRRSGPARRGGRRRRGVLREADRVSRSSRAPRRHLSEGSGSRILLTSDGSSARMWRPVAAHQPLSALIVDADQLFVSELAPIVTASGFRVLPLSEFAAARHELYAWTSARAGRERAAWRIQRDSPRVSREDQQPENTRDDLWPGRSDARQ